MSRVFSTRIGRLASASIFVVVAALSLGAWMLFWDPVASSAAPTSGIDSDVSAAAAKLEALHQRTVARTAAQDDDDQEQPSWGHVITPEQAATLAQQLARARGDATPRHTYMELQTRNGRPVYMFRIGT